MKSLDCSFLEIVMTSMFKYIFHSNPGTRAIFAGTDHPILPKINAWVANYYVSRTNTLRALQQSCGSLACRAAGLRPPETAQKSQRRCETGLTNIIKMLTLRITTDNISWSGSYRNTEPELR